MWYAQAPLQRLWPCRILARRLSMDAGSLYEGLIAGDRFSLSRSITLVESLREDQRREAQKLLSRVLRESKPGGAIHRRPSLLPTTFRIGLSGSPGVGKSTFIEAFGMYLINKGHKVAVLAVDPSSSRTGGSILGDKTRMELLSRHDSAYVRPSPSSCTLGGVARNTSETILLCEAGGYDIVLVETVGVGQSETMVSEMVDMFTLLVAPGGGDEMQGIKKGIVELSDLIVVNKADGVLSTPATMTQMEYTSALKFVQPSYEKWRPKVMKASAKTMTGIDEVWSTMLEFYNIVQEHGELEGKRSRQQKAWMWRLISDELTSRLKRDQNVKKLVQTLEQRVEEGEMTAGGAADRAIKEFIKNQQQIHG